MYVCVSPTSLVARQKSLVLESRVTYGRRVRFTIPVGRPIFHEVHSNKSDKDKHSTQHVECLQRSRGLVDSAERFSEHNTRKHVERLPIHSRLGEC